jgi:membrane-bound lytic murein transglycosylase B
MVYENFRVFMRYNASTSYALAAGLLSDRISGRPGVAAAWPRQIRPLARDERLELQRLLAARGLDVGVPDGIVGQNTRRAIRVVQKQASLPPDGFPTPDLLELLRGMRS